MPHSTKPLGITRSRWLFVTVRGLHQLYPDNPNRAIISKAAGPLRYRRKARPRVDPPNGFDLQGTAGQASDHVQVLDLQGQRAAVKDNFMTYYLPTTCASNMLRGLRGPQARVMRLLEKAGVNVVAKTNMDEFGMGSHSTHSAYGAVQNGLRHEQSFSAGGSSGGSAMAVATKSVDFALGSDTGGSVRLPAAYTNTVGFKPSYGRISRHGLIPYANSLDTVGILARDTQVVMAVFNLLNCGDDNDPTCLSHKSRGRISSALRIRTQLKADIVGPLPGTPDRHRNNLFLRRCRIGVPLEYNIEELHPLVRQAWAQTLTLLEANGHDLIPISLPTTKQALSAYYVLAPAEASSNLAKYDGVRYGTPRDQDSSDDQGGTLYAQHRGRLFGDEVKRRILLGSFSLSAGAIDNYFIQAQKVRRMVQDDFNQVFRMPHPLLPKSQPRLDGVDYIVCPTAPTPPPTLSEVETADSVESYINDVFTVPASLAGLPALSVPAPLEAEAVQSPETAVGIQIIGQYGDDDELLRFARRFFEKGADWKSRRRYEGRSKIT